LILGSLIEDAKDCVSSVEKLSTDDNFEVLIGLIHVGVDVGTLHHSRRDVQREAPARVGTSAFGMLVSPRPHTLASLARIRRSAYGRETAVSSK
jgi:hypothetical protein